MGVPLAIIHFSGMFPSKNQPFWGSPIAMETPILGDIVLGHGHPSSVYESHCEDACLGMT